MHIHTFPATIALPVLGVPRRRLCSFFLLPMSYQLLPHRPVDEPWPLVLLPNCLPRVYLLRIRVHGLFVEFLTDCFREIGVPVELLLQNKHNLISKYILKNVNTLKK